MLNANRPGRFQSIPRSPFGALRAAVRPPSRGGTEGSACSTPRRAGGDAKETRSYSQLHLRRPRRELPQKFSGPGPRAEAIERLRAEIFPAAWDELGVMEAATAPEEAELELLRLRRRLATTRRESTAVRQTLHEALRSNVESAKLWSANRERVGDLLEEEQAIEAVLEVHESRLVRNLPSVGLEEEVEALREEVAEQAEDVRVQAEKQILKSRNLKIFKALAKLQKARLRANAAVAEAKGYAKDFEMKTSQLKEAEESTCALRFKATSLKEEVAQAKAEAAGSNKLPNQLLQVLQSELKAEEQRSKIWHMIDTSREKSQVAIRAQMDQLSESLKAVQDLSGTTAAELQDAESMAARATSRLKAAQKRAALLAAEARHLAASQDSLEAELQRQRDATKAWQSCGQSPSRWQQEPRRSLDGTRLETLKAKKDIILLVQISEQTGRRRGYVIPQPAEIHEAGWISLEDVQRGKSMQPPLLRLELPGSWDLKARYCVQNPATLRAGPALDSDWIGELNAGCEVLLLDFGVTSGGSSGQIGKARLRALVFAGDKIGWMSPETGSGDHLLKPVNLLSRKVVDMHKQTLRSSGSGVRKSYQQGGNNPWEAGATYRMLEKTPLRSGSDLKSSEVGKAG
ncbi:Uncharacterized protein SCF082_LOCUS1035 [Durusdinium trenchii]|uniref:Uncharacterized protein n=1 Tax=Durusdinium trenchii TaxID=1381693 RepID=A0ABP0HFE9_9DINO